MAAVAAKRPSTGEGPDETGCGQFGQREEAAVTGQKSTFFDLGQKGACN